MTTLPYDAPALPVWIKIAAALGMAWYAFGLVQFYLGASMDVPAAVSAGTITEPHGAAITATPALIWASYALASGAGLVGAVLLFMRHPAANIAFALSLISAGVYYLWIYALSGTAAVRPSEEATIAIVVLAVTLGFVWLSRRAFKS